MMLHNELMFDYSLSNPPNADSIGLNLIIVSVYSLSGLESPTIPQPANNDAFLPFINPERMATANSPLSLRSNQPTGLPYQPRSSTSSSRINSKDFCLGCPPRAGVGCNRFTTVNNDTFSFAIPLTGVYKCCISLIFKIPGCDGEEILVHDSFISYLIICTTTSCSCKFLGSLKISFSSSLSSEGVFPRRIEPAKQVLKNSLFFFLTSLSGEAPIKHEFPYSMANK